MTNILKTLILIVITTLQLNAQNTNITPFIGTWEHNFGNNKIFRVIVAPNNTGHVMHDPLYGRYQMIELINGTENIIYTSDLAPVGTENWEPAFYSGSYIEYQMGGLIVDGSYPVVPKIFKFGDLSFKILPINCLNCPIQAHWEIFRLPGIKVDEPADYNLPIDLILTKVN
jgi:hypothetical protein